MRITIMRIHNIKWIAVAIISFFTHLAVAQSTPIFQAAEQQDIAHFNDLLPSLSELNSQNEQGLSLLSYCSSIGFYHGVTELIAKGANVNFPSANGTTALMMASDKGYASIVAILLESGASTTQLDTTKMNALDHCVEAKWLESAGEGINHNACYELLIHASN